MKITVLGCGGSVGVPAIGNLWGECDPAEPRNYRTRPSILIENAGKIVLVDAGPDLRTQMLAAKVNHIDAVLLTHFHADHTIGIDDLRMFALITKQPVQIYASAVTLTAIRQGFDYMFQPHSKTFGPFLAANTLEPGESLPQFGIETFEQTHKSIVSMGLRCGAFAYSTDVSDLNDAAFTALEGVDTWIVAALRREPHPAHATLATVLQWIERVQPRRAILTHMNNMMDYRALKAELPPHVEPGYDGMTLEFEG